MGRFNLFLKVVKIKVNILQASVPGPRQTSLINRDVPLSPCEGYLPAGMINLLEFVLKLPSMQKGGDVGVGEVLQLPTANKAWKLRVKGEKSFFPTCHVDLALGSRIIALGSRIIPGLLALV
jgi:hypothetical protein